MKKGLKYAAGISIAVITIVLDAVLLHLSRSEWHEKSCSSLDVRFEDNQHFIDSTDVKMYLDELYGPFLGQRLEEVDLQRIERIFATKSAVSGCEAWVTGDGVLHISVAQRIPVAKFEKGASGFYCDGSGFIFPLHNKYSAKVPVVKGAVENAFNEAWLSEMIEFINYYSDNDKWHTRISDIVVEADGSLTLKTPDRGASFLFGQPCGLQDKFRKMDLYYDRIVPQRGREHYKTVNLNYNGQIICRTKK